MNHNVLPFQSSADKVSSSSTPTASAAASAALRSDKKLDPLQNDWRQFSCHSWHLEPTVR